MAELTHRRSYAMLTWICQTLSSSFFSSSWLKFRHFSASPKWSAYFVFFDCLKLLRKVEFTIWSLLSGFVLAAEHKGKDHDIDKDYCMRMYYVWYVYIYIYIYMNWTHCICRIYACVCVCVCLSVCLSVCICECTQKRIYIYAYINIPDNIDQP